jgi:hypothetical protein
MSRLFGLGLLLTLFASSAVAAEPAADAAPEKLLSPTTQLFVRWDGVTAHAETYKKSFWGPLMAGPSGDSVRALIAKVPKLLGNSLLAEPLLDGKPPAELKANLADLKNASKLIDLLTDKGVLVGAEVREPKPTLKGIGQAFRGLLGGELPGVEALLPDLQALVIIPNAGDQSEVLFATLRLALGNDENKIEPFTVAGRKGFRVALGGGSKRSATFRTSQAPAVAGAGGAMAFVAAEREFFIQDEQPQAPYTLQAAWWVEGKHFVLYVGTMKPDAVVAEVAANPAKGGVTGHALYKRSTQEQKFTSVARGFVDAGKVVSLAKSLAGPFVPGLNARLDELGFGNLKGIVINCGYDGREFRAVWEMDLPGERKGLAKVLKGSAPIGLKDLPPLPADVNRFLAMRIDPEGAYNAGLGLIEALTMNEPFGPEEDAKTPAEGIRLRREYLAKEFDKIIGVSVKDDILPCLGDKVVVFQSPNEGLSVFGTVVCVSLKDPAKAKAVADRIHRGLETLVSAPVKVRKKMVKGVEVRELYSRGFGFLVPTYAVVGDWLVVSVYPQGVQGMVLRMKGDLPSWKPDADTLARLAKLPKDGCTLQYCDPTSTVKNLCTLGPLFLGTIGGLGNAFGNDNGESDYEPLDIGLIPNGHELSKHLFPNLTVIRDDGTTVRLEVNESLSVPLEIIGLEPLVVGATIFGFRFF